MTSIVGGSGNMDEGLCLRDVLEAESMGLGD